METFTLLTVTASNVFSIIPILSFIKTKRYVGACIAGVAGIASVFMHATETKHQLPGLFLKPYSNLFLNIDRVIAVITGLYGVYLWYTHPQKNALQIVSPIVGALALGLGEKTNHLPTYTVLHCIWHALAFYSLHLVNY